MPREGVWVIGASPDCDIVVDVPTVSGRHCRLVQEPAGFLLEDLGSTNGTYVNGSRITALVPVQRTDVILMGSKVALPWPETTETPRNGPAMKPAPLAPVVAPVELKPASPVTVRPARLAPVPAPIQVGTPLKKGTAPLGAMDAGVKLDRERPPHPPQAKSPVRRLDR
jgi:pSer/pThr/pTyr-binding forkhead associated (FHA) protein